MTNTETDLTTEQLADQRVAEAAARTQEERLWLALPIAIRPLEFVPGRNRREKRTFRKLASMQERGTITKGRKGRGGQLAKLHALYQTLLGLNMLKQTSNNESNKE